MIEGVTAAQLRLNTFPLAKTYSVNIQKFLDRQTVLQRIGRDRDIRNLFIRITLNITF